MSQLIERRFVRSPYHLAQRHLAEIIGPGLDSHGPLRLTLPLSSASLVKDVVVTYEAAIDPMRFDQPWRVRWAPKAGPYPKFDGELTVRADENYETSQLELKGSYRPPGGILGAAFDRALGERIASATAQALLERLAGELELRYDGDEEDKERAASS